MIPEHDPKVLSSCKDLLSIYNVGNFIGEPTDSIKVQGHELLLDGSSTYLDDLLILPSLDVDLDLLVDEVLKRGKLWLPLPFRTEQKSKHVCRFPFPTIDLSSGYSGYLESLSASKRSDFRRSTRNPLSVQEVDPLVNLDTCVSWLVNRWSSEDVSYAIAQVVFGAALSTIGLYKTFGHYLNGVMVASSNLKVEGEKVTAHSYAFHPDVKGIGPSVIASLASHLSETCKEFNPGNGVFFDDSDPSSVYKKRLCNSVSFASSVAIAFDDSQFSRPFHNATGWHYAD